MGYYSGDRTGYAQGLSHPRPGLNATTEYQVSGRPWIKNFSLPAAMNNGDGTEEAFAGNKVVDDATAKIEFPNVAKRLVIENESGADIQIYFCSLMVPVNRAAAADLDEDGDQVAGNPCARGDKLTEAELNAYLNKLLIRGHEIINPNYEDFSQASLSRFKILLIKMLAISSDKQRNVMIDKLRSFARELNTISK